MSQNDSKGLFRRSDGLWEDGMGNFAVVMLRTGGRVQTEGMKNFAFRPSFTSPPIDLSWPADQTIALFPQDVVTALIARNHGRLPTDEEVTTLAVQAPSGTGAPPPTAAPETPVSGPHTEELNLNEPAPAPVSAASSMPWDSAVKPKKGSDP